MSHLYTAKERNVRDLYPATLARMGFVRRLRALLRRDREQNADEPLPYSLVLLMRKPFLVSKPMLEAAGSAAFGVPYDGSDPMHFVVQEARS